MLPLEPIKIDCTYEERTSTKDSNKKFKALFIKISDKYEKIVFLSVPEQALIESNEKEKSSIYDY